LFHLIKFNHLYFFLFIFFYFIIILFYFFFFFFFFFIFNIHKYSRSNYVYTIDSITNLTTNLYFRYELLLSSLSYGDSTFYYVRLYHILLLRFYAFYYSYYYHFTNIYLWMLFPHSILLFFYFLYVLMTSPSFGRCYSWFDSLLYILLEGLFDRYQYVSLLIYYYYNLSFVVS